MKKFKEFLNEIKLQKFAGYRKGDTVEFNADIVNNKPIVKRGVVVANTKGTEDVTLKVDGKEVVVPYSKTKGVVSKVNETVIHNSNNKLQLDEANRFASNDQEFTKLSKMTSEIKEGWRDIRRAAKKQNIEQRVLDQIGDKIEDAIIDLNKALKDVQDVLKKLED